jgi:hypothetical protein
MSETPIPTNPNLAFDGNDDIKTMNVIVKKIFK